MVTTTEAHMDLALTAPAHMDLALTAPGHTDPVPIAPAHIIAHTAVLDHTTITTLTKADL